MWVNSFFSVAIQFRCLVWFGFVSIPIFIMRYKNPQLLIIHTASELSWCVFLRPLELSVRVEPLFNCDDGCFVKPFWWHSGRGDCDFKSFSYEKMWFKLSTGSQNRISSWLGIFVRGHWNFSDCLLHTPLLGLREKTRKRAVHGISNQKFDTPLSSVFFFSHLFICHTTAVVPTAHRWIVRNVGWAHLYTKLSNETEWKRETNTENPLQHTMRDGKKEREQCGIRIYTENIAVTTIFFCILLVVLVEFNEIIIWYGCKNYKNRHPFEPHHFWVFFLFSRYFDIRLM